MHFRPRSSLTRLPCFAELFALFHDRPVEKKIAPLSLFFLALASFSFGQNGRERRTNANNRRSLLMERSSPVAERLIPNAGCANGANDHRIRHVRTIKQLGPGLFFPLFAMRAMRYRRGKQPMTYALHTLRYR